MEAFLNLLAAGAIDVSPFVEKRCQTKRAKARRDKGHEREIELTLEAMRGGCSPIPFEELVEVSEATIAIEEAMVVEKALTARIECGFNPPS